MRVVFVQFEFNHDLVDNTYPIYLDFTIIREMVTDAINYFGNTILVYQERQYHSTMHASVKIALKCNEHIYRRKRQKNTTENSWKVLTSQESGITAPTRLRIPVPGFPIR